MTVRADGGLPVVCRAIDGKIVFLPFREEEGFGVWRERQDGEVMKLFPIRKRGEESPAWETRPLDGVSEKVNVM